MADIAFVVPFGRDGAADRAARRFVSSPRAPQRGNGPGPNLLIENHPGSGGLLGVQRANELARTGRPVLLLATPSTHVLLPARLGAAAGVDPAFQPVLELPAGPNVLLVPPRLGVSDVAGLVAHAHTRRLVYASAGAGQTIHVCTALFCELAGIEMTHRPYEAGSEAPYADLASGAVDVYFDNVLACAPRIARGEVVPLAVSAVQRTELLPQVATMIEQGYPGHVLEVWLAVFGAHLEPEVRVQLGGGPAESARLAARIASSRMAWTRALAYGSP